MVKSFVFQRNNKSAVCLEEENCEETTRNSVQWKINTANHETPAEYDDLGSDFNPRNGRPILPRSRNHHEMAKNIWNWWKRSWSYTWLCIIAKYLCTTAPCYRAKIVTDFLKTKNIKLLEWPENSLDLNPIENFWKELKNRVAEKHPTGLPSLIRTTKSSWVLDMPTELCQNLIESMPRGSGRC